MARKKTVWGKPGETGVTRDGIPWAVPETGPGLGAKIFFGLFPGGGALMPAGAKFVPAGTAADLQQRIMRKCGEGIAALLDQDEGEHLVGFSEFLLEDKVPQPPRGGIEARVGPNPLKRWWMGGGWDTVAGQLVMKIGGSRTSDENGSAILSRHELLIRTDRRVMIWGGSMEKPLWIDGEYGLSQIGISPVRPLIDSVDDRFRVDIAFPDGSWIGATAYNGGVPGGSEIDAHHDLLAELVGPPVTSAVLPALGRK